VAYKQERVTGDVIATEQFLLDEPILFRGQGTRKAGIGLRHVIGMKKTNQSGQLMEPRQFLR
jgi:hypothetical protein